MARQSSKRSSRAYVRLVSGQICPSEATPDLELHPDDESPFQRTGVLQKALWILAGTGLIGFAVSALWWDPVSCPVYDYESGISTPTSPQKDYPQDNLRLPHSDYVGLKQNPRCNPFLEKGTIHYNSSEPGDNTWQPFREDCPPSTLFSSLRRDLLAQSAATSLVEDFKWLRNRTVVLIGDSIDRYHALDFCELLSRQPGSTEERPLLLPNPPAPTTYIGADSPLSPPPWHFYPDDPLKPPEDWPKEDRKLFEAQTVIWDEGKVNANSTRPRVCRIPKYGFTMVSLFTWGLEPKDSGRLYAKVAGYFPPAEYRSRVDHILIPLLQNLARYYNNPQILKPDLIEIGSGFWDLRSWAEEDLQRAGLPSPPTETPWIAFSDLSTERMAWWSERQRLAIRHVAQTFDNVSTPILWRSLHHVQRHYWVAYNRVFQLDQLARYNIEQIKKEDSLLNARLRVDEWGALMLGQEHHFRDVLHVAPLPGGALWGDVILWELKRALEKRGEA